MSGDVRAPEQLEIDRLLGDSDWADPIRRKPGDAVLTVSTEGWEGPLDLLLALARTQKVDLREISILALVEQYLRCGWSWRPTIS